MTLENTAPEETQPTETTEAPAVETEPTETVAETSAEGEPANDDTEAAATADTEQPEAAERQGRPAPRSGGWQRRIDKLERENATKEALIEQLLQHQSKSAHAANADKAPEDAAAAYIESLVEQRLNAREEHARRAREQAEFQRRTAEVRAAHPDFDEVISGVDVPVSKAVETALLTSEHGPAIMYQLASNPAELARLSALPPFDAAREIGRLEAKAALSAPSKANPKAVAVKRVAAAPAPIKPVTARGPTNVKPVEQMSYEEYNAWRDSQRKR